MIDRWSKHNRIVDDQKWSAMIAYVRAYNEWSEASKRLGSFDPSVQKLWDSLLLAERQYKRMVKK